MGYSLFWLAVRGKSPEAVRAELRLRSTGEREDIPESDLTAIALPDGWYIVVDNRSVDFGDAGVLGALSQGADVVTCFVEEHVMASEAAGWAGGKQVWSISHQSDKGVTHLDAKGELSSCFEELRAAKLAEQEKDSSGDVDYMFDVPVDVAQAVCGYRHDEDPDAQDEDSPFEVLEKPGSSPAPSGEGRPKKDFWKRLFS